MAPLGTNRNAPGHKASGGHGHRVPPVEGDKCGSRTSAHGPRLKAGDSGDVCVICESFTPDVIGRTGPGYRNKIFLEYKSDIPQVSGIHNTMSPQKFFNIASYKTASRCWVPINNQIKTHMTQNTNRFFSSQQRVVNFNNIADAHTVSNDGVLSTYETPSSEEVFEPTVFSSEEVHTAGPVNKA